MDLLRATDTLTDCSYTGRAQYPVATVETQGVDQPDEKRPARFDGLTSVQ